MTRFAQDTVSDVRSILAEAVMGLLRAERALMDAGCTDADLVPFLALVDQLEAVERDW